MDLPKMSKEILLEREHQTYPPDLLTFPLRNSNQVSPSGMSSLPENQVNKKYLESPMKSTKSESDINTIIYHRFQNTTMNHSTSPLINPKVYVTLPRRPRVNYPENIRPRVFSTLNGVIPCYDSFNMKLFGQGGSYCNLNKSEMDLGPIGKFCLQDDVDEAESAPSPAPGAPHATIPRNSLSSPNIHNQLLTLQAMSVAASQARKSLQQRPLKVTLADSDNFIKNPVKDQPMKYSINVVSGTLGRTKTVSTQPNQLKKRHSGEIKEPFLKRHRKRHASLKPTFL